MKDAVILLVEDNPDDEALILRALHRNRVSNPVIIVHDGVEALEFIFAEGSYALGRTHTCANRLISINLPRQGVNWGCTGCW